MSCTAADIEHNLATVKQQIVAAAERSNRPEGAVRLVAVTKTVGIEEAQVLRDLGVMDLGENRVETARAKVESLGDAVRWHMIGSVQRRKVRDLVDLFPYVDSVDRLELAEALSQRGGQAGKDLHVLVEVNASGETSKHGFDPDELPAAVESMRRLPRLHVDGLMTMAPFVEDPETVRPCFARLRGLAWDLGLPELSMGMSNDFEVAIEEGATQVRIGTALFV